jgi:dCMP deaminase
MALWSSRDTGRPMAERPGWDAYFLAGAEWVATRADCTRSAVGAILVNASNEVRGTGYNGAPAGVPGCATAGACPRGQHHKVNVPVCVREWHAHLSADSFGPTCQFDSSCTCGNAWPCDSASAPDSDYSNCTADHAERNAIRHTRPEERLGATLYTTRAPCPSCWTLIVAAGIRRVVTHGGDVTQPTY